MGWKRQDTGEFRRACSSLACLLLTSFDLFAYFARLVSSSRMCVSVTTADKNLIKSVVWHELEVDLL